VTAGGPIPERCRVVRIIARLNVGGPALQATVLATGLDPDRFEQHLLSGAVTDDEADYVRLRAPDLVVQRVAGLGRDPNPTSDIKALVELRRAIRAVAPQVVHTHTTKAGVLGRLAAWSAGVPVTVHTFHGHHLSGYFSPRVTKALVMSERLLARRTTRLVAVGTQVRDDLLDAGIGRPDQYVVVPPGVALPPLPPRDEARHALDLELGDLVVAFVARLTNVKRPDRFLAMATAIAARQPKARFLVVGGGDLFESVREQAAPLGDRIRFLGWRSDVETIYAASDLVVLTSDNEGMPVSLIEAAICGVPVVTTGVGSAAEVVLDGVTGRVTGLDTPQLIEAVDNLLGNPALRRRMAVEAAAHARRSFGANRLVRDIDELYSSLTIDGQAEPSARR
jgi:glycosyltransferase involved in cell wall biosynthesis